MKSVDLAVINCEQLLTCRGRIPKRADLRQDVGILEKGCIASHKGRIVFVGDERRLKEEAKRAGTLDVGQRVGQVFLKLG